MSAETQRQFREVQAYFRLPSIALVEKDLHVVRADAQEFRNQYPAYAGDIAGETQKTVIPLRTDPIHRERYIRFMAGMVYGERPEFETAMATVDRLTRMAG